jgi:NAD(P)-dependent dehydrogenase (short-subunit alcohol dehydrogenase family)
MGLGGSDNTCIGITPNLGIAHHGTKYAIEGISESLAKEVAAFGIKVTII